ncbi:SNAP receptor [Naganishia albida]|nr:SNAP receptor [Naganishia albida]
MSFDNFDLERRAETSGRTSPNDRNLDTHYHFDGFKNSISLQIFKVNSNVQGINRLIDKLGTVHDGATLRKSLYRANLTESTRRMIERSGKDIQEWAASVPYTNSQDERATQQRIAKEFSTAILAFQRSQKVSAEKLKHQIAREQKRTVGEMDEEGGGPDGSDSDTAVRSPEQVQLLQQRKVGSAASASAFQESLIAERELEIRDIETGIHELNDIFHDLNKLVGEQGDMIDNIESNVTDVEADTRLAGTELTAAHEYQRKAGRRMVCLMLLLVVVITVVLLAILS